MSEDIQMKKWDCILLINNYSQKPSYCGNVDYNFMKGKYSETTDGRCLRMKWQYSKLGPIRPKNQDLKLNSRYMSRRAAFLINIEMNGDEWEKSMQYANHRHNKTLVKQCLQIILSIHFTLLLGRCDCCALLWLTTHLSKSWDILMTFWWSSYSESVANTIWRKVHAFLNTDLALTVWNGIQSNNISNCFLY